MFRQLFLAIGTMNSSCLFYLPFFETESCHIPLGDLKTKQNNHSSSSSSNKRLKIKRAGETVQLVEYVPSLGKALGPALAPHKLGVLVACLPS